MVRHGFGLIEVIVALTVLGIAVVGVSGASLLAMRLLHDAEITEQGAQDALQLIDSLVQERAATAGERTAGRLNIRWQVDHDSGGLQFIGVEVTYPAGASMRTAHYHHAQLVVPP